MPSRRDEAEEEFRNVDYQPLNDAETPSKRPVSCILAPGSKAIWFLAVGAAVVCGLLLIIISLLPVVGGLGGLCDRDPGSNEEAANPEWNDCGATSEAAMARGCVMEPLVYGWMPPRCRFDALTRQFPVFEDRAWYEYKNLTKRVPVADLWRGKHRHIYTHRFHSEHCLFQWRKLQYGMHSGEEWLDNRTASLDHSRHCADLMASEGYFTAADGPRAVGRAGLGFYICKKAAWYHA